MVGARPRHSSTFDGVCHDNARPLIEEARFAAISMPFALAEQSLALAELQVAVDCVDDWQAGK